MIKYKIDVLTELKKKGFSSATARDTGTFSQSSMIKFAKGDATISLDNLNRLCAILELEPKDIIAYEETEQDARLREYKKSIRALNSVKNS